MPGMPMVRMEGESPHLDCIHCGLCLSVCPTYQQLGSEIDSPRGRIYLIDAMTEGRIPAASNTFGKHMDLCLECRACETACPSGVRFSVMMNDARARIRAHKPLPLAGRILFDALTRRRLLHALFRILRLYQRTGARKLVTAAGIFAILPRKLKTMEALLPDVPKTRRLPLPETPPARPAASLFEGCIMPELFGPVHEATVRVLQKNGVSVCRPRRQTCCGALHLHEGEREGARRLARRNIEAFERDGADFIVVNSAGCGSMLKEYGLLLADDPVYAERARAFSRRVRDISEILDEVGIRGALGRVDVKAAYDDACHLLHGQRVREAPKRILAAIPGLELAELREADRCCGSAGVYNILQPEMAERILEDKISNIARSGAKIVLTGNPGCLLQIRAGLRARNLQVQVMHPVELLDLSYRRLEPKIEAAP